jgi:hypothetical protein
MKLPFFEQINDARTILLAGAGGGFDIFGGLPLYFWLRGAGKTVHLANLSFAPIDCCEGEQPVPGMLRVMPDTDGPAFYFPELFLAEWLAARIGPTPIYAIQPSGVKPVLAAYQWLVSTLRPDTILVVDGGTDSLMRGDEAGLGTPAEDVTSLAAAELVPGVERKFLACIGFGIDVFHGVCHASFLENVAGLIETGGYLGSWSLMREMPEFKYYKEATQYVSTRTPHRPSIVHNSIVSAAEGRFGDYHGTWRTKGSTLFINPLMAMYWTFQLSHVVRRNLYLQQLYDTGTLDEVCERIVRFRDAFPQKRPWTNIPC